MRAIHHAIHFDVTSFCVLRIELILLRPSHRADRSGSLPV
jgi:hypothetical protein